MTEIRTTSASGGQKGTKPQRMDLLPWKSVMEISEIFGFGSEKYEDHNWRKGYEWSKNYAALQRHLALWWEGEDLDSESGLSHLGHAGFHILALLENVREHPEYDDRWSTVKPETLTEVGKFFADLKGSNTRGPMLAPPGLVVPHPEYEVSLAENAVPLDFDDPARPTARDM